MKIKIVSRIFEPEPSAASFRLSALARAFSSAGHTVTVETATASEDFRGYENDTERSYRVKRFPVLRDKTGYVRGYVPYMSFDIPLFLRLLFGRRVDLIVSEPPPTTGAFVRLAAALRRIPYAYYAADIWSDAAAQMNPPKIVLTLLRALELYALRGARVVLSVSEGLSQRLADFGVVDNVATIGNGVDAERLRSGLAHTTPAVASADPVFVYPGTASEWHGASIFVEALPAVLAVNSKVRLHFIGGGADSSRLLAKAEELGVAHALILDGFMTPEQLAPHLYHAVAAIASIRPGPGHLYDFPTKLYSAVVCGSPLLHTGPGPANEFVQCRVAGAPIGAAADFTPVAVARMMLAALERPIDYEQRARVSAWGAANYGLTAVAQRAVQVIQHKIAPAE